MKNLLFCAIFGLIIFGIDSVEFTDCGSAKGKFTKISISGCDDAVNACVLHRKTNVSISIDFKTDVDATALSAVVHGEVMGLEVPFTLPNPNGCVNSGVVCPLKHGSSYEYLATLPVLKSYPKVHVTVKWELKDEAGEDIVCVTIPAKIE